MPWGLLGASLSDPWRSLWIPWGSLGDTWGLLGIPSEAPRTSQDAPRDLLDALVVAMGAFKNIKKRLFLLCFEHLAVLGGALGTLGGSWDFLEGSLGALEWPSEAPAVP